MKKVNLNGKLSLRKETLSKFDMNQVAGGGSLYCTLDAGCGVSLICTFGAICAPTVKNCQTLNVRCTFTTI
jgi:hypothetical protein